MSKISNMFKTLFGKTDYSACHYHGVGYAYFIHIYKIFTNCNDQYTGMHTSSDLTVCALKKAGYRAKSIGVIDANGIDEVLFEERPTHLIIKAFWITPEKLKILAKKYPSCKFIVCCHSKPSFLGMERSGFDRFINILNLSKNIKNISIACNNFDAAFSLKEVFKTPVLFLPNLIYVGETKLAKGFFLSHTLNVGLFCSIRPPKNILNQAIGAMKYCSENRLNLNLHVITNRVEMSGNIVLKNLKDLFNGVDNKKYKLIEYNWMSHDKFLKLIAQMDIGLQSSFTESFNLISVDFMVMGIPIVTSSAVEWSPSRWQANPDSMESISDKMGMWLKSERRHVEYLLDLGFERIKKYNEHALHVYDSLAKEAKKW